MNELAPINHNASPEDVRFDELLSRKDQLRKAANGFLADNDEINDEETSAKVTDFVEQLRACERDIEAARKEYKAPHKKAGDAVHIRFNGLKPELAKCLDIFKRLQGKWLAKLQAKKAAETKRKEEEALEKLQEAEDAQKTADQPNGDIIGNQVRAEDAQKTADLAVADADMAASHTVKAGGNFAAKAMSLRTIWHADITDMDKAVDHYRDHPKVHDLILQLADADARSPEKRKTVIPGVEFKSEQKAA